MKLVLKEILCLYSAVKSFNELGLYVLSVSSTTPLLSRQLNHDPLEKYFGLQMQRGRVSDNSTAAQYCKNSQALRVAQSCALSVKGNCRGDKDVEKQSVSNLAAENHTLRLIIITYYIIILYNYI